MAISDKVRTYFEKVYGFPLSDAFEVQQHDLERSRLIDKINMRDLDKENARLADYLAAPIYVRKR